MSDVAASAEAQRAEIEAEQESQPLLSDREPPSALLPAYADNPAFSAKLADLCARWRGIRRCRGDGQCFYRSLLVSMGEKVIDARVTLPGGGGGGGGGGAPLQAAYEALLATVAGAEARLVALGYPASTVPDFLEALSDWLLALAAPGASAEASVHAPFREKMTGWYILYGLRLLTALELRSHEEEYGAFIVGATEHASVAAFCEAEVEASAVDADELQITALVRVLKGALTIAYLDASPGDAVTLITFPRDAAPEAAAALPLLATLLYRPGHYDVVYAE